jgi:hypothetical protein
MHFATGLSLPSPLDLAACTASRPEANVIRDDELVLKSTCRKPGFRPLLTSLDFRAENEGPIGAAASILGHRDTGFIYVWMQQVLPMAGTFLPTAHHVAVGFKPRCDILCHDPGAITDTLGAIHDG